MAYTHDHVTAGHPGQDETIRKKKEIYQWPAMNNWITNYVKGCATCQQNKIITHRKKTSLYGITVPSDAQPFQQIAMDLITGLPLRNGKDAILTPNQILIRYETTLAPPETPPLNNQTTENQIKNMIEHRAQAIDAINKAAKGDGSIPEQYSIGDQVWLKGKHLSFLSSPHIGDSMSGP